MQLTSQISVTMIDDRSCCEALQVLAAKHHLTADHPLIQELQELVTISGCEDLPLYLVHRAQGTV